MNYYAFHIGDYRSATAHLSNGEDLAYRRLLDMYYDTEQSISLDIEWVARRIRISPEIVKTVLQDMFEVTADGWSHARCHQEILEFKAKSQQASRAGKASAQRRANVRTTDVQPTNNQEPLTINHIVDHTTDVVSKPKVSKRGSRIDPNWSLPKEWADWAKNERPDLNVPSVGEQFKDFWISKAGAGATKLDWQATWRNWVRNQKAPRLNPADIATTTVPGFKGRCESLVKLDEERKNWKPPSPEIIARIREITKSKVVGVKDKLSTNKETP
jgi:uncharacterized protein YdaU (DUF1376 family)